MITLNGIDIKPTIFPDKTSQVWKIEYDINSSKPAIIKWDFESEAEFMHLAQLKTLLDVELVEAELEMPYLPYARQDKPVSNSSTFALTTFAYLINSLNFRGVTFFDVHSSKALKLFRNSYNVAPKIFNITNQVYQQVCFPDKGASQRYKVGSNSITLEKTRDQLTGNLQMKPLQSEISGTWLIVDDICDGGGTFILAAKELYEAGADDVHLYVSHGIFSKGLEPLKEAGITKIYTHKGLVK